MASINYFELDKTHIASFTNLSCRPFHGDYVCINGITYKVEKVFMNYDAYGNSTYEILNVFVSKC